MTAETEERKKKRRFKLRNLFVDRVDHVDRGANQHATIELYKRAPEEEIEKHYGPGNHPSGTSQESHGGDGGERLREIDRKITANNRARLQDPKLWEKDKKRFNLEWGRGEMGKAISRARDAGVKVTVHDVTVNGNKSSRDVNPDDVESHVRRIESFGQPARVLGFSRGAPGKRYSALAGEGPPKQEAPKKETPNQGGSISSRPIHEIARDIRRKWGGKVNFAAKPYLDAMGSLDSVDDMYGADTGRSVVAYFLSNASSFRGEDAKKLKAELKEALKIKKHYGPGDHQSGSSQDVHGGSGSRGSGSRSLKREKGRIREPLGTAVRTKDGTRGRIKEYRRAGQGTGVGSGATRTEVRVGDKWYNASDVQAEDAFDGVKDRVAEFDRNAKERKKLRSDIERQQREAFNRDPAGSDKGGVKRTITRVPPEGGTIELDNGKWFRVVNDPESKQGLLVESGLGRSKALPLGGTKVKGLNVLSRGSEQRDISGRKRKPQFFDDAWPGDTWERAHGKPATNADVKRWNDQQRKWTATVIEGTPKRREVGGAFEALRVSFNFGDSGEVKGYYYASPQGLRKSVFHAKEVLRKHSGPGAHPVGSGQDVHGNRAGAKGKRPKAQSVESGGSKVSSAGIKGKGKTARAKTKDMKAKAKRKSKAVPSSSDSKTHKKTVDWIRRNRNKILEVGNKKDLEEFDRRMKEAGHGKQLDAVLRESGDATRERAGKLWDTYFDSYNRFRVNMKTDQGRAVRAGAEAKAALKLLAADKNLTQADRTEARNTLEGIQGEIDRLTERYKAQASGSSGPTSYGAHNPPKTIDEVKAANEAAGKHFFDPGSMKAFKSKIESDLIQGKYFITSEVNPSGEKRYSVREVKDFGARINTVGEFHSFDTHAEAKASIPARKTGKEMVQERRAASAERAKSSFKNPLPRRSDGRLSDRGSEIKAQAMRELTARRKEGSETRKSKDLTNEDEMRELARAWVKRHDARKVNKRTPGIARALRALAAAKKRNKARMAEGKKPIVEGEEVSPSTLNRKGKKKVSKQDTEQALTEVLKSMTDGLIDAGVFVESATGEDLRDILPTEVIEELRSKVSTESAEIDKKEPDMADIDLDALDPEVVEYIATLEAESEELQKSLEAVVQEIEKMADPEDEGGGEEEDIFKNLDPEVFEIMKADRERLEKAEGELETLRIEKANSEFIAKAATFEGVVDDPDAFGPDLRAISEMDPEVAKRLETVLTTAAERIAKGELFAEFGSARNGLDGNAYQKATAIAKNLVEQDPNLTLEAARAQVWESNPDLYDEYQSERRK